MRIWVLLALLITASANGQMCPPNAIQLPLAEVHALRAKLFSIPEIEDDLPTGAPAAARIGVPALLSYLAVTIESYMRCDESSDAAPPEIERSLAALLDANRPASAAEKRNGYPDHTYGDDLTVRVNLMSGSPDVLAVNLSFSIACGDNHMLLLFQRTNHAWRKTLDWHSSKYTQPSDAFGDFFVYALVPGQTRSPRVAVAYGTPWCTSRMSGFHIDLLHPADEFSPQALLGHRDESYSRDDHVPSELQQTSDGFQIRVWDNSLDFDNLFTRPRIFRFNTTGNKLERIQPIADNARDFVDAWLQSPWTDSQKWTQQPTPSLHLTRNLFDYSHNKNRPEVQYGPVRACSSRKHDFQIEIDSAEFTDTNSLKPTSRNLPPLFAEVRQNQNFFTMIAINDRPDPRCTGSDLMKR